MNNKEHIILFDTESIGYPEDFPGEDILCQLAYLEIKDGKYNLYDDYTKPKLYKEITPGAMSVNKITPEELKDKSSKEKTEAWTHLKDILEKSEEEVYLVAHKIDFDIEVIKLSGIKPNNVKIIDTLKIANYVNDNLGLLLKQSTLQYIKYYYRLYKKRDKLDKILKIDSSNLEAHNAIPDVLDLFLVYKYFIQEMGATSEELHNLTISNLVLDLVPFGKNRGDRFDSLNYNQLKYYATLDGDVGYTAKLLLS